MSGGENQGCPAHYGDPRLEYQALATAAGLADFSHRTRIELSGADRASFLHNLCTNEIRKLEPGGGCEAFLLDARGHVLGHVFVVCRRESLLLETVADQEQRLLAHLDRYLIRERVELHARGSELGEMLLAGPESDRVLSAAAPDPLPTGRLANVETALAGRTATVVRVEMLPWPGYLVVCPRPDAAEIRRALCDAGAAPVGSQAIEVARIEAGFPWYGIDITEKNLPQEVARDPLAISFIKGCYIGQETVARIDALGHVNRLLRGIRFSGSQVPEAGLALAAGGTIAGQVTSATYSPRLEAPLALAYLRRGSDQPGTQLETPLGQAEAIALPLSDRARGSP